MPNRPADESGSTPPSPPRLTDEVFGEAAAGLASRAEHDLLLSVPIWGWSGDGKTVALLTAHYFLKPNEHGIGIAAVTNPDALRALEETSEVYRGMNLVDLAEATNERITPLIEEFVSEGHYPAGTDAATAYLFSLRTARGALGYLFMPDLRGGSYQKSDEQAREVLRTAHATIVLVLPDRYVAQNAEGKRYRDAVMTRIQDAIAARIPMAVLISQADRFEGEKGSAADSVEMELTTLLGQAPAVPTCLERISVVGEKQANDKDLPAPDKRKPQVLLRAFVWALWKGLSLSREQIQRRIPSVAMRPTEVPDALRARTTRPELRLIAMYSNRPGTLVASAPRDSQSAEFVFLSTENELVETLVRTNGEPPSSNRVGKLLEFESSSEDLVGYLASGTLTVGPTTEADSLWYGTKGSDLPKTSLPMTLNVWTNVSPGLVVGIDTSGTGRLCSFRLTGNKWKQVDHVPDFIRPTDVTVIGYVQQSSLVIVLNGTQTEAVLIRPDGTLGERVELSLNIQYAALPARVNGVGIAAGMAEGAVVVSSSEKAANLEGVGEESVVPFAIAGAAPVLALVTEGKRLVCVRVGAGGLVRTTDAYSPLLEEFPSALMWSPDGGLLVAAFESGRWAAFRPVSMGP